MFGIYRYGLAFCVAISHLWAGMIGGPAAYAVWGFYCLSGFLMTLILNEKYGFSRRGLVNFAFNRMLRIYPAYYAVCAGMFLLFCFVPDAAARFLPNLHMPRTSQGWRFTLLLMTRAGWQRTAPRRLGASGGTLVLCCHCTGAGPEPADCLGLVPRQCRLHALAPGRHTPLSPSAMSTYPRAPWPFLWAA